MQMMEFTCETEFAPAERAAPAELEQQVAKFAVHGLLQEILDAMPTAVVILNAQRQIVYGNALLLQVTDAESLSDVIGLRPGETLYCIHAFEGKGGGCGTTHFCSECGAVRAIQSSLMGLHAVEECSIARRRRDTVESLDLRVWATPLMVEGEGFVIFAIMDIAHERRRQALERIFFHDILNTVTVLQSASELLHMQPECPRPELVGLIHASAQQLVQEIRTQRDLLAAENGTLAVFPKVVATTALFQQLLEICAQHPVARGRILMVASQAEVVEFVSDPVLLIRVLGNMVKNALEASAPGDTVTVSCERRGEAVCFTVHNVGYMPEPVQLQIFQRSFSTKGSGRGLGTYSMKLLSERYLQGAVTFRSTPEEGTTFTATYPLCLRQED